MQEESQYKIYLSNFDYLHPFWRYMPTNFEVVQNQAKFCMFLAAEISFGRAPEILDPRYEIRPSTDHRAKFHADWPTHLDLALKKINNK